MTILKNSKNPEMKEICTVFLVYLKKENAIIDLVYIQNTLKTIKKWFLINATLVFCIK